MIIVLKNLNLKFNYEICLILACSALHMALHYMFSTWREKCNNVHKSLKKHKKHQKIVFILHLLAHGNFALLGYLLGEHHAR